MCVRVTCVGERGSAGSQPGTGLPEEGGRAAGTATPAAARTWRRSRDAPPGIQADLRGPKVLKKKEIKKNK